MENKNGRYQLAQQILALCLVGGVVATLAVVPGLAQIFKLFDTKSAKDRYRIKRSVAGLEREGFIKRRNMRSQTGEYQLTEKGYGYMRKVMLKHVSIPRTTMWDKRWRVLMFDIPEDLVHIRREVSVLIREMGMKKMQNSVFVSPYPCVKEIKKLAEYYSVEKYLIYLETETLSCAEELRTHFKLG